MDNKTVTINAVMELPDTITQDQADRIQMFVEGCLSDFYHLPVTVTYNGEPDFNLVKLGIV